MLQNVVCTAFLRRSNYSVLSKTLGGVNNYQGLIYTLDFKPFGTIKFRLQTTAANNQPQAKDVQAEWENARSFKEIPRPSGLRLIRNYLPGGKYYGISFDKVFELMKEEYGDIMLAPGLFGKPQILVTFNANDFESVFRNEGIWPNRMGAETLSYHRLKHRADFFKGIEGLITSQGEEWGNFRSKVNPVMMQPKNVRLYLQKLSQVNNDFIEVMKKLRDPKTNELPDNFENYINRWTLESVSAVALDRQLGLLKNNAIDPMIQKLFDGINEFMRLGYELDNKPSVWKIIATPDFKLIMKAYDDILEVTSHYINEALERLEAELQQGIEKPDNEKSVLEKLLKIDKKVAIVMAMDMLMAGVDTTTSTFTALMLCLAKNPEKQAKLRKEVLRVLPNKDSEFTEASLNDMSYLRACIKESMRVYPLIVGNGRMVQRDVVLSGYKVPKGVMVAMITTSVNNDEKLYPQPNEFIPERWLRTPKAEDIADCPAARKSSNPFAFLPFGFGPRSCIGRRIAELELELGAARIIRNFNVGFNYSTENAFKYSLINVPNIPLKFELKDFEY